jgi:SOS-response transcriptional repressor LexA
MRSPSTRLAMRDPKICAALLQSDGEVYNFYTAKSIRPIPRSIDFLYHQAMDIRNWIKSSRQAAKLTQEQLGEVVGVTKGNVSAWEVGRHEPSYSQLLAISRATGCPLSSSASGIANVQMADTGLRRVPLISYVQAGSMTEAVDPYEIGSGADFLSTDLELSEGAFALQIKGESMTPEFREGDRVIIDPEIEPNPGDYVVAKNGKNEATFKKYRPRGLSEGGILIFELVPLNEDYPSLRSDREPIAIIGTMIEHRRYRKR